MNDVLYMAWRYVRFHWGKTVLLVSAISLVLFLPAGLYVVVEQGARTLTARAESTAVVDRSQGERGGSDAERALFPDAESVAVRVPGGAAGSTRPAWPWGFRCICVIRSETSGLSGPRSTTPTSAVWPLAQGRWFGLLGECVLGAEAARVLGVDVGDAVLSSAGSAFDVAGAFPLKMPVVGVLKPTGTVDDEAVFVDVKTTWVISGLAHGHDNVNAAREGDPGVLEREEGNVVANADGPVVHAR